MNRPFRINRRDAMWVLGLPLLGGCLPVPETGPQPHAGDMLVGGESTAPSAEDDRALRDALDRALETGYRRRLSCQTNGAWQVLHGVLAYGQSCMAETEEGWQPVVPYLLAGGRLAGWEPLPGDILPATLVDEAMAAIAAKTAATGNHDVSGGSAPRRGIRFELEAGSLSGQGHCDQWLAVLLQSGLDPRAELVVGDRSSPLAMALLQALWSVSENEHLEYSWTIIAATQWLPTDFSWQARDGARWSIERIVATEATQTLVDAACGGTHRLIGLAMALQRRREEGAAISGVWREASRVVDEAIVQAARYQNSDGSFATTYLHGYGWSPDMADVLRTTGHVLEVLAVAASSDQLRESWVERSAARLCHVLELTAEVPLECGALYHALHGVMLYRQRRFPDSPWRPPEDAFPLAFHARRVRGPA